ncbi:MAG TPA: FtsX-like permease family protein [Cyclobacteriaceae bacterium]|nr:FtsX-like permease family protein [Cyclobacteriaceae bacterium]
MNLSLFIARRYFFSKRKKNFINIISGLSMVGVAFSTAALVIVLSVFNGLEGLIRSLYTSFDPPLKIEAREGKSFPVDGSLITKVKSVENVEVVTEVIEDYAYLRYRDADMIVTMKGVGSNFIDQHRLDGHVVDGELKLRDSLGNYAIIGRGVQYALSISPKESLSPLQVFYIKNSRGGQIDPSKLYSLRSIQPGAVFAIEKNIDENYVLLPLEFVQDLMSYGNNRTSLEVKVTAGVDIRKVQASIKKQLGQTFSVLTNDEQHQDIYRLVKIEKLFTFIALTLLILVASINIFFSLMMLAIDKKKDISILTAMGAQPLFIKRIFLSEGALIAFAGAAFGLVLGGLICWAQDRFGIVGMGMNNAIVSSYPVKMKVVDFAAVSTVIVAITLLISFYPAKLASRSYSIEQL